MSHLDVLYRSENENTTPSEKTATWKNTTSLEKYDFPEKYDSLGINTTPLEKFDPVPECFFKFLPRM